MLLLIYTQAQSFVRCRRVWPVLHRISCPILCKLLRHNWAADLQTSSILKSEKKLRSVSDLQRHTDSPDGGWSIQRWWSITSLHRMLFKNRRYIKQHNEFIANKFPKQLIPEPTSTFQNNHINVLGCDTWKIWFRQAKLMQQQGWKLPLYGRTKRRCKNPLHQWTVVRLLPSQWKHNWQKWLLGRQPALGGHSRDTRRALAFHLGHSRVTCVSLQLHLSFTRSFLIHTSFTCGSLGQQSVQWMLHNWIIRAWKPASSKHSPVLWFSAKALPCFVTSMSLEKPLSPFRVSMKTLIVHC